MLKAFCKSGSYSTFEADIGNGKTKSAELITTIY